MAGETLTLGGFNLVGPHPLGARVETMSDGSTLGNPDAISETIESFLVDATLDRVTGYGNRTPSFRVRISGTKSLVTAAENELLAVVMAANETRSTRTVLTWSPPDGLPVALDVFTVTMERDHSDGWDFFETTPETVRHFELTFKTPAFMRSVSETTVSVPAPPAATPTVTDYPSAVSSTSNWAAASVPALSAAGNRVVNGTFESNLGSWTVTAGTAVQTADAAAKITGSGSGFVHRDSVILQNITLASSETGRQFKLAASVRGWASDSWRAVANTSLHAAKYRIAAGWRDASGSLIRTDIITEAWLTHGTLATPVVYGTAPAGAASVDLRLETSQLFWNVSYGGSFYPMWSDATSPPANYGGIIYDNVTLSLAAAPTASIGPTLDAGIKLAYTRNSDGVAESVTLTATRNSLSIAVSTPRYLKVGYTRSGGNAWSHAVKLNGTAAIILSATDTEAWVAVPASITTTVTSVEVTSTVTAAPSASAILRITSIKTSTSPTELPLGGKQALQTIPVNSGVRTPGSLHLSCATGTLGEVIVYSRRTPGMASPDLRSKTISGGTETVDTACVSGKRSPLTTAHLYGINAGGMVTGTHEIVARIKPPSGATSVPVTVTATSRVGAGDVGTATTRTLNVPVSGAVWQTLSLGDWLLPAVSLNNAGQVRIQLQTSLASTEIDEAWVFNIDPDEGEVLRVRTGAATHLWMDQPSASNLLPAVWVGTAADRSDAHGAAPVLSFGTHRLTPPAVNLFVISEAPAAVEARYYPQWGWNASST